MPSAEEQIRARYAGVYAQLDGSNDRGGKRKYTIAHKRTLKLN